jgi:tripartite-type tricarboxylate transporter receptor subunit TctC
MRLLKPLLAAALLSLASAGALSQSNYPNRPVRLISGFAAGGTVDIVARSVAQGLTERLGQNFVVENRTGANGILAAQAVKAAPADGYTVWVSNSSSLTVNPHLFKNLPYDVEKDFIPVAVSVSHPLILSINPKSTKMANVKTLKDFLALAKSQPGGVTYGSAGNGNVTHLGFELMSQMAGVKMTHVPYRGAAAAQAALLQQEVDVVLDTLEAIPRAKAGLVRMIAVTSPKRLDLIGDVPTVAEQGIPGFDVRAWVAHLVPSGTPADVVEKLNKELNAAALHPMVKERLATQGTIEQMTPKEFADAIRSEGARYADVIRKAKIEQQ